MSESSKHVRVELPHERQGRKLRRCAHTAMACDWGLLLIEDDARYARQIADAVFAEVDRVEAELSRFRPDSDIARLNIQPPDKPLRIGHDAFECLQRAEEIRELTGGAFDVAWQRGRPTRAVAAYALDQAGHTATRLRPDVRLDLGGIGKGYALDRAAELLRDWGAADALLHAGQSTVLALVSDEASTWRVGLRDVVGDEPRTVDLASAALAGSGQVLHGEHIIDPNSGEPVAATRAAWALAADATTADALSTALMVMPLGQIEALCKRQTVLGALIREEETVHAFGRLGRSPSSDDRAD